MYSVVLLAALTAGDTTADFGFHKGGCYGCYGCYGCHGCHGGWGCHGCYGCYGYGCCGYAGSYWSCSGCCGGCYGGWGGCYGGCYGGCWGAPYGCYGPAWMGYGCYGGCGGVYSPAYTGATPLYAAPAVPGTMVPTPAPATTPEKGKTDGTREETSNRARLIIDLPEGARLFVDGNPVRAEGKKEFKTPALARGETYFYEVRAEVMYEGKPVSETRRVVIRAGDVVKEDFHTLVGATKLAAQR